MNTTHIAFRPLRAATFACLVVAAPTVFAQTKAGTPAAPATAEKRQIYSVTETVVKPDKVQEFERLQKEELNPALKKAGVTTRFAYSRGMFGEGYTYVFSTPIDNYARYDEPNPLNKVLGEEGARALSAKLTACHVTTRTFAVRSMPNLTHATNAEMALAVITVREFVSGKRAEWVKFMQDEVIPATKKSDSLGLYTYETMFGGPVGEVATLSALKNYAELDGPTPIARKLGAEASAALFAKQPQGVLSRSERWIIRLRKELSILPDTPAKAVAQSKE